MKATNPAATGSPAPGAGARALRSLVSVYRAWSTRRPPNCRFVPSCSAYAEEALTTHGALRGSWLAMRRLGRCRPGGGHGYDPVPEHIGRSVTEVTRSVG